MPQHLKPAVSDEPEITGQRPDFGELSSCSCPTIPSPTDFDAEAPVGECRLMASIQIGFTLQVIKALVNL